MQANYMPVNSLFLPLHLNKQLKAAIPFFYFMKASVPQTQGTVKPLAKMDGLAGACPFRLSNGIFHFEEGSENTREANRLNRSIFFMVITADRTPL